MNKVVLAVAVVGLTHLATAQNCSGFSTPHVFSRRENFEASFWYNLGAYLFDLNVQVPIRIGGASTWLFDQGTGNPQVGKLGFHRLP